MKKKIITLFFICGMALFFAVPVMAQTEVAVAEAVYETIEQDAVEEQGITPFTEMTRAYFRTYNGVLQFRIWSITNGRWLTYWIDL